LGNHDHWTDAALITDLFRAEGITVLINEGMHFEKDGASFWLAGVDDTMVGLEDLSLALAGARRDEMKLLLAHNPIVLRRAARASVDLVLCGHTHGGQVAIRGERSTGARSAQTPLEGASGDLPIRQIYVRPRFGYGWCCHQIRRPSRNRFGWNCEVSHKKAQLMLATKRHN
jgi:hypothetical protein